MNDENLAFVTSSNPETVSKFMDTIDDVCTWAMLRRITAEGGATALSQAEKMKEELQEFIDAQTFEESEDAIGDMFVVLIQMARLRGHCIDEALFSAYEQIKDRKGTMVNGVFVKQAD